MLHCQIYNVYMSEFKLMTTITAHSLRYTLAMHHYQRTGRKISEPFCARTSKLAIEPTYHSASLEINHSSTLRFNLLKISFQ
jgi:hypothetical protein